MTEVSGRITITTGVCDFADEFLKITSEVELDGNPVADANMVFYKSRLKDSSGDGINYEEFEQEVVAMALYNAQLVGVQLPEWVQVEVKACLPDVYDDPDDDDDDEDDEYNEERDEPDYNKGEVKARLATKTKPIEPTIVRMLKAFTGWVRGLKAVFGA